MNKSPKWEREEAIFQAAAAISDPEKREIYLQRVCGGDLEFKQRIEAELQAQEQTVPLPTAGLNDGFSSVRSSPLPQPEGSQRIGHYRLLEKVGEGGYGVVYKAEQTEPVRRQVALKILKAGMDTGQVVARFEAERQALAMMEHPNIAKVLDGGTTETGRPFFVMELVRGMRITDYCDQHQLSTRQRLEIFIQVCQAVQHAHQKGIIHRDLKPSNILVAAQDGKPVPKVIDFGIAKALEEPLTEKTVFTAFDRFIGTPAYMSPEQAGLDSLDIDTRSDIYSLGVLLYELLTGKTPFEVTSLLAAGLDEMRRILREEEPPRPSTRVLALEGAERTSVARRRQTEPAQLVQVVRGDLDWIAMKCLEKDRARRYETTSGLASDLQHYLNDEPVAARPPSNLYRAQKLVYRHRWAFTASGAVGLALLLGLGVSTWLWLKEKQARHQAVRAESKARTEASKSLQVAKFLKEMFQGADPAVALGRDTALLREILAKAAVRIEKELGNQPEVQAELLDTLGTIYGALGQYGEAEPLARRALELRRRLFAPESPEVSDSLGSLAAVEWGLEKLPEAEGLYREALSNERKLAGAHQRDEVTTALSNLAGVLREENKLEEAEKIYREALGQLRQTPGKESDNLASTLSSLATVLWSEGKLAEAEGFAREALAMRIKVLGPEHPDTSISLNNLAALLRDQHKLAEAETFSRQAVALKRKMLGPDHPDLAISLGNLAALLNDQHKWLEAEPLLRECLAIREKAMPGNWRTASTRSSLGACLMLQKKYAEAEPLLLAGYEAMNRARDQIPPSNLGRLQETLERLVQYYEATNRPERASQWRQKLAEFR